MKSDNFGTCLDGTDIVNSIMVYAVPKIKCDIDYYSPIFNEIRNHGTRFSMVDKQIITISEKSLLDIFFIERGEVNLVFDSFEGRRRLVISFGVGALFNLASAVSKKDSSGQFVCTGDCRIWRVDGELLRDPARLSDAPHLVAHALYILSTITLTCHTYLTDMLLDVFVVRFCRFLAALTWKHGTDTFPLGCTQENCAAMLGVHRATLVRAINYLRNQGVLGACTKRRVHISNVDRLWQLAGMDSQPDGLKHVLNRSLS